jgi:hypothetical protein
VSAIAVVLVQAVAIPLDYVYLHLLTGMVDSSNISSGVWATELAAIRPSVLLRLPVVLLLAGLLSTTVSRSVLGRPAPFGEVWAATRPRFWRVAGAAFLVCGGAFGCFVLGVLPGALISIASPDSGAGGLLAFLGGLGGGAWALNRLVCWLLAPTALLLEVQPVRTALKRSAVLVKGAWWRTLWTWVLALLVSSLVTAVLQFLQVQLIGSGTSPVTVYSDGTYASHAVSWAAVFGTAAFSTAVQVLIAPFGAAILVLLYVDRRMRREALDIELTRQQWQSRA